MHYLKVGKSFKFVQVLFTFLLMLGIDFVHEIENREDLEPEVKESIADLPQTAVRPLIREKDPEIKENVIQSVRKTVKTGKHPLSGKFTKKSKPTPDDNIKNISRR